MNPSQISHTHQLDIGKKETPFNQVMVQLTKEAHIQLKWDIHYWRSQHERAIARESLLKQELEVAEAEIRDLKQRLYGKRSEKSSKASLALQDKAPSSRSRGQALNSQGHGRTPRPQLPVIEEWHALPVESQFCSCCHERLQLLPLTEDADIIEIEVKAYVRRVNAVVIGKPVNAQPCLS